MAEKGGKSQQAKNVVCNAKKLGNQFTLGFNSTVYSQGYIPRILYYNLLEEGGFSDMANTSSTYILQSRGKKLTDALNH